MFVDEAAQAITIGECQHAFQRGPDHRGQFSRQHRRSDRGPVPEGGVRDSEITLFDGTGVALQDLAVADLAVRIALQRRIGSVVAY